MYCNLFNSDYMLSTHDEKTLLMIKLEFHGLPKAPKRQQLEKSLKVAIHMNLTDFSPVFFGFGANCKRCALQIFQIIGKKKSGDGEKIRESQFCSQLHVGGFANI